MRILMATHGSTEHVLPLAPFARACRAAGHEVLVAAQPQHAGNVRRAGLPYAPLADPPAEEWMPLLGEFGRSSIEAGHERMVRDFFAGVDARASLPALAELAGSWRPDVMVRESWEFAAAVVAEAREIPLARVGLGLAAGEELTARLAAPAVDALRRAVGLAPDPDGDRLRAPAYLTMVPAALEDAHAPARTHRFRPEAAVARAQEEAAGWWSAEGDPLVYMTLGTVAAAAQMPFFPAVYRAAIDALAALPVRVLVTLGEDADPAALGPPPPNVRLERWVPQEEVLRHAAAVVSHGGYGTTLGALAHGVPLVVVPLFSFDQWMNAAAVERAGAGVALGGNPAERPVFGVPDDEALAAIGPAVERAVGEPGFAAAARRLAAEMEQIPPPAAAVDVLDEIRRGDPLPTRPA